MPEPAIVIEPEPETFEECERCESRLPSDEPKETKKGLPFNFGGKLFPRGLGNEELLILALILMTSQSEDGNEIFLYLILLLFC